MPARTSSAARSRPSGRKHSATTRSYESSGRMRAVTVCPLQSCTSVHFDFLPQGWSSSGASIPASRIWVLSITMVSPSTTQHRPRSTVDAGGTGIEGRDGVGVVTTTRDSLLLRWYVRLRLPTNNRIKIRSKPMPLPVRDRPHRLRLVLPETFAQFFVEGKGQRVMLQNSRLLGIFLAPLPTRGYASQKI